MPHIFLIRHDKSDYSGKPRSDFLVPLVAQERGSRLGAIGETLVGLMRNNDLQHSAISVYHSPLMRTSQTAVGISRRLTSHRISHELLEDYGLREIDRGPWGRWPDDVREKRMPNEFHAWKQGRESGIKGWLNTQYPAGEYRVYGECPKDILRASLEFLLDLRENIAEDSAIAIVGHDLNLKFLGEILLRPRQATDVSGKKDLARLLELTKPKAPEAEPPDQATLYDLADKSRKRTSLPHGGIWHVSGLWGEMISSGITISSQSRSR